MGVLDDFVEDWLVLIDRGLSILSVLVPLLVLDHVLDGLPLKLGLLLLFLLFIELIEEGVSV